MKKIQFGVLLLAGAVMLSGCVVALGNRGEHGEGPSKERRVPTVGQELMDLKKARDTGAMTEDEYQAARAKIVGKCNK